MTAVLGLLRSSHRVAVLASGLVAVAVAVAVQVSGVMEAEEQQTLAQRFTLRGEQPVDDVALVAVDDESIAELGRWPFRRSLHARAVDALREAGVRQIVYDVQFSEPTRPREDLALYDALGRARGAVLAATAVDEHGDTAVFGGRANLAAIDAVAASAAFVTADRDVYLRFPYATGGLRSLPVATARRTGVRLRRTDFEANGAWIDYRGAPGTIPTVPFSRLLQSPRRVGRSLAGKIVVVGVTAPTEQDVHATPVSSDHLMSGPEIQANAIWTALHGLPLRSAPGWTGWLAIVLLGIGPAAATLWGRVARAGFAAVILGVGYLVLVQAAFEAGYVLHVVAPLVALLLGTMSGMSAAYVAERERRRRVDTYNARLEREVRARTEEVRDTQLEIVRRLGRAVEWRDADTGSHIDRMSTLAQRLGLAIGLSAADAELLRRAAALHDVGKVGVPDAVLRKPGALDPAERRLMQQHTTIGAAILTGSSSPLIRHAEAIALAHHERWDGSGYPRGLRGEEIPLTARICAVCDVFDALLSPRPYKKPWPLPDVLAELQQQRGRHFDPALVDAFLALVPRLEPELLTHAPTQELDIADAVVAAARAA
jgi:response regulator RpfG family c-di-GMP phosphodiesterase